MSNDMYELKKRLEKDNIVVIDYTKVKKDVFRFVEELEKITFEEWVIKYLKPDEHEDFESLDKNNIICVTNGTTIDPSAANVNYKHKLIYLVRKIPQHPGWGRHYRFIMDWRLK